MVNELLILIVLIFLFVFLFFNNFFNNYFFCFIFSNFLIFAFLFFVSNEKFIQNKWYNK